PRGSRSTGCRSVSRNCSCRRIPWRIKKNSPVIRPRLVMYPKIMPNHGGLSTTKLTLITPTSPPPASRITSPIRSLDIASNVFDQSAGALDNRTQPVTCSVSIACCKVGDINLPLTSDTSYLIESPYTLPITPKLFLCLHKCPLPF